MFTLSLMWHFSLLKHLGENTRPSQLSLTGDSETPHRTKTKSVHFTNAGSLLVFAVYWLCIFKDLCKMMDKTELSLYL